MVDIRELLNLKRNIELLGIAIPDLDALSDQNPEFDHLMPVLIDLISTLKDNKNAQDSRAQLLVKEIDRLLADITSEENPRQLDEARADRLRSLGPPFEQVESEYKTLFQNCQIRPEYEKNVFWYIKKIISRKSDYEDVSQRTNVPWYFIAIIHGLEASFRFDGHLHNGDPLERKTVQVPKGRPLIWNPPNDWNSSAADALIYEGFSGQRDWSIPRMLYRWESYNGWGSRRHGINTPYLWSFSNHYTKGKFVKDGVYDSQAVSKQCGAGVMLKSLINIGDIAMA